MGLVVARAVGETPPPFEYVKARAYHVLPETHNQGSGYFSLCEGLDGRVYVGTAKYGVNAYLVEFDPRTGRQRIVLDTHKLCGLSDTRYAAQAKLHTRNFVGPSGKVYVGSKQGYRFEKDDTSEYPGGYVMSYDPRTGEAANLGMPMKGQGVIDVVADEQRGLLYVITCEDQHWMVGDITGKAYRELGPLLVRYGATLIDADGRACAITADYQLAQYDPKTQKVTIRPIEVGGKRWSPEKEDASIPTWVLTADARRAYLILMGDPTLLEIELTGPGQGARAASHGKMLAGKGADSRCALTLHPDGKVYALVRIDNTTGFGQGHLHHLVRFDPAARKMQDLGVLAVENPDFFDFEKGPDGKKPSHANGYHKLPDGTLTPLYHHMALTSCGDGTLYATVIAPFTLLRMEQFKLPAKADASPAAEAVRRGLAACDRAEAALPQISRIAEVIAERHANGGMIGFVSDDQTLMLELWGRAGAPMHLGFDRPWKKERNEQEMALDVALGGYDRPPKAAQMEKLRKLKARGCYVVGFGPKGMKELEECVAACDVWIDSGVAEGLTGGAGVRANMLANAVNGWTLIAEVVGALTRRGKMPVLWKSFSYDDGREWMERYFQKVGFHEDHRVPPFTATELGGRFLGQIRAHLVRLERTQLDGLRQAAAQADGERQAGRRVVVSWQGHMPWHYAGRLGDEKWADVIEFHPFIKSQVEEYRAKTPAGALVIHLGYNGTEPEARAAWTQMGQRVVQLTGAHPDPVRNSAEGLVRKIDLGFALGDACVSLEGYPARLGAPSGIMQLVAYDAISAEVAERPKR
jgi:hypothetical protein